MSENRDPNHLSGETSPYLLQHVYNPVDWHPWSPETLAKARREDKPIFLSIGYSACHWCHVMERESFENDEIAAFLNANFVSIKVDREERPDIDDIYMSAVQLLAGQGGWPLSVWLTPDLKPFFGGTYFPPEDRWGRVGFRRILERVLDAFRDRRGDLETTAQQVADRIASFGDLPETPGILSPGLLQRAADSLTQHFDRTHGGFGSAPKFPPSMGIRVLLRQHLRAGNLDLLHAATTTLDRMAAGGIYDHLGGGFHRYSTDDRWLVPHFEKMLYDQALLVAAYVDAHQATGSLTYDRIVRETLDYVLREMTSPEGAFYSSQDADTEGEEGKYFVWSPEEILDVLGEEHGRILCRAYDVDEVGNFEGRSILHPIVTLEGLVAITGRSDEELTRILTDGRARLLERRETRVRPGRDEKIILAWNGLMISAFAQAGRVLDESRYVEAASKACDFLLAHMRENGRLLRIWKEGRARFPAYLEDYAALIAALTDLFEAEFDRGRLEVARELAADMIRDFGDDERGGFWNTTEDHQDLIVRLKNAQDGSVPSGNSLAATSLLRLGRLTGDASLEDEAERTLRAFLPLLEQAPGAVHQMLVALDLFLGPRQEIVIVGPASARATGQLMEVVRRAFLPRAVVAWTDGRTSEPGRLFEGKTLVDGEPAAYLCSDYVCERPVTRPWELEERLGQREARQE